MKTQMGNGQKIIVIQQWEESEAGWGTRPCGWTIHITSKERDEFVEEYMTDQQNYYRDRGVHGTPNEYDRPAGQPKLVEVSDEAYAYILEKLNEDDKRQKGIWGRGPRMPPDQVLSNSQVIREQN